MMSALQYFSVLRSVTHFTFMIKLLLLDTALGLTAISCAALNKTIKFIIFENEFMENKNNTCQLISVKENYLHYSESSSLFIYYIVW